MRVIAWVAYATLFLLLFGLALNNQHEGTVKGFFGAEWRAPMIVVLCLSFGAGAVLTLLAMLPAALRRNAVRSLSSAAQGGAARSAASATGLSGEHAGAPVAPAAHRANRNSLSTDRTDAYPPRDGL